MTVRGPSISVIMACYNDEKWIGRAIESILNQTFSDFEFIIVDDASTDGTFPLCQQYAQRDGRIVLSQQEKNSGSCTLPLNVAIKQAKANIIARMDADDLSHLTRFEKQFAFLQAHPEVDVLGTGIRLIDKDTGQIVESFFFQEYHKDIVRHRYFRPFLAHPTIMIRKKVYDFFGGYNESLQRRQDTELWLKAYPHFTFHNLQEVLFDYYRRPMAKGEIDFSDLNESIKLTIKAIQRNGDLPHLLPFLFRQYGFYVFDRLRLFFRKATPPIG